MTPHPDLVKAKACMKATPVAWERVEALADRLSSHDYTRPEPDLETGIRLWLDLWTPDPYLHGVIEQVVDALPFRYIRYAEFRKAAAVMFRKAAARLRTRKQTGPILFVNIAKKSNVWMLALFVDHCRRVDADTLALLKAKLQVYTGTGHGDKISSMCDLRAPNATLLYLDDASYSGRQIHAYITAGRMTIHESSDILVGLTYVSGAAAELLRPFSAHIVKARLMPHLSAAAIKSIPEISVNRRKNANVSVWKLIGADRAPCRTFFEHKVADATSLPGFLTRPVADISYAAFTQAYSSYEKPDGDVVQVQERKAPPAAALAKRLGRRGLFSDAFCPMKKRGDCFVPVYKNDAGFVLEEPKKDKKKSLE